MESDVGESQRDDATLRCLFRALATLTTPQTNHHNFTKKDGQSNACLDQLFEEMIQTLILDMEKSTLLFSTLSKYQKLIVENNLERETETCIRDRHVEILICLLNRITDISLEASNSDGNTDYNLKNPKPEASILSAQQLKTLTSSLQFLIVLGICPYLSPGVGVPLSQRLGPGQILLATSYDNTTISQLTRVQKLIPPVRLLCDMLEVSSLRDVVIDTQLGDLLTALFQLRFSAKIVLDKATNVRQDLKQGGNISGSKIQDQSKFEQERSGSSCSSFVPVTINREEKQLLQEKSAPGPMFEVLDSRNRIVYPPEYDTLDIFVSNSGQMWTIGLIREHCNKYIDRAVRLSNTQHILKSLMMLTSGGKSSSMCMPVKTPAWYRRTVAALLRDVLMVEPAVHHLISLLMQESGDYHDWQKCKAVAQVISQLPTTPSNHEQFYRCIVAQILTIVQSANSEPSPLVSRVVGATILELNNREPDLMDNICFSQLLEPLLRISNQQGVSCVTGKIPVPELDLGTCVCSLHKVFVLGQEPMSPICTKLEPIIGPLFSMLLVSQHGISPLKSKVRDLLAAYLGYSDIISAVSCIINLAISTAEQRNRPSVSFISGHHGDLKAEIKSKTESEESFDNADSWTQQVDAVLLILTSMTTKTDDLIPQLFIMLLQKLTTIVKTESNPAVNTDDIVLPVRILTPSQRSKKQAELREKICLISLLGALGDKYGEGVVSSAKHVIEFCKATLERCVQVCQVCNDEATMTFEWETVSMAMGLLTAVLTSGLEIGDQSSLLDEILPLLNFISQSEAADDKVREMADDIKVAVATKGLVWAELSKTRSSCQKKDDNDKTLDKDNEDRTKDKKKPLIEMMSETTLDENSEANHPDSKDVCLSGSYLGKKSALEQALSELCDPMVPVRGHGLIALARLVEEGGQEVRAKKDLLLKVFLENLSHSDSYIYLAAVNGLSALSDLCPDKVIPCLTTELRTKGLAQCTATAGSTKDIRSNGELGLKLGEALVKATRKLGELAPKYRDLLLSSLLCLCRHDDPITRASALSGMADVCQLLRFALGPVLHEIVTCCRDVIDSDTDPQPRKAAALTFTLILRGLGKESLQALDEVLLDVYRVLKRAAHHDADHEVRTHALLALEEIDTIMRDVLFAKPQLSKKITILGHP